MTNFLTREEKGAERRKLISFQGNFETFRQRERKKQRKKEEREREKEKKEERDKKSLEQHHP